MAITNGEMTDSVTHLPLVSIIINNYNYGRFLAQAIRSALDQTYKHIEVIVVDDGSTDESRSIIESFRKRIRSVLKENGGQGSAYNAGFSVSSGELIHFLDSDDVLMPSAIQEVVNVYRPGISKIQFYLRVIEGAEGRLTEAFIPSGRLRSGELTDELIANGNYTSPPSTGNVYSRAALAQILPMTPESWITAADLFCIFQCPFLGVIQAIGQPLGFYRVHGNNIDAQTLVTAEILRYRLKKEEKRELLLSQVCGERAIPYTPGTVSKGLTSLKIRFASQVLDPQHHPYKLDTKLSLLWKLNKACWTDESSSSVKQLLFSVWSLAVLLTSGGVRSKFLSLGFAPIARPAFVQRLLSFAMHQQEDAGHPSSDIPAVAEKP